MKTQELVLVLNQEKRYFIYNIMGDEFLLNFDVRFLAIRYWLIQAAVLTHVQL